MARKRDKTGELTDLQRAYESIALQPDGQKVLQHIFSLTGYDTVTLRVDHHTGEINHIASLVNQGKRDIWLWIQKELSPAVRKLIEIPQE